MHLKMMGIIRRDLIQSILMQKQIKFIFNILIFQLFKYLIFHLFLWIDENSSSFLHILNFQWFCFLWNNF